VVPEGDFPLLAHHWDRAERPGKAVKYLEKAGERAALNHSNREAVGFLGRAVELAEEGLIEADPVRRSDWERILGEAQVKLSNYRTARDLLNTALKRRGLPNPRRNSTRLASLTWHIALQAVHRMSPVQLVDRARGDIRRDRHHAAKIFKRLGEVAFFNDEPLPLIHATFTALNMAESSGSTPEMVNGYGSVGIVAGLGGLHGIARKYVDRGTSLAESLENDQLIARADLLRLVYAISIGDWETVDEACIRGCELFGKLGDRFRWESCRAAHGYGHLFRGAYSEADEAWEETFRSAREGALQSRLWARAGQMASGLEQGGVARRQVDELVHLLDQNRQHTEAIMGSGLLAKAKLLEGDLEGARQQADSAFELLDGKPTTLYYTLWGLAAIPEVYLELWAAMEDPGKRLRGRAEKACKILGAFGRMFPVAVPRARISQGRLAWLGGKKKKARRLWAQGLEQARALGIPGEESLLTSMLTDCSIEIPPDR
jgi:hypothetical protein